MRSVKHRKHKKNNSLKRYKKKRNNKRNKNMIGGDNNSFELKDDVFDNKTITNDDNKKLLQKFRDIDKLKKIISQRNFTYDDIILLKKYYKNYYLFYIEKNDYDPEITWDSPYIIRPKNNFNIVKLIQQLEDKKKIIETRIKLLEENENKIQEQTMPDSEVINPIFQSITNEGKPPLKIKNDQLDFDKLLNKYKEGNDLQVFKEGLKEIQTLTDILNKREINTEEKQKLEKYYDNIDMFYTKTFEVDEGNDTFFPENKKFDKDKTIKKLEEEKRNITRFLETISLGSENTSIKVTNPSTTNIETVGLNATADQEKQTENISIMNNEKSDKNLNEEVMNPIHNDNTLNNNVLQEKSFTANIEDVNLIMNADADSDSDYTTLLKKTYDDQIKENENKIQELLKIQESEKIRIKNITDTSAKIDSQNAKMVSELEEIQNALNSSIQNDNNCQNESNSLKISIEKFKKQNIEADNKQKELIQELQKLQTHNTEIQESYNKINEEFMQKNTILETQLTETKQREKILKSELDKRVKETIVIKQVIGQIWNNIQEKCIKESGTCEILQKWNTTNSIVESLPKLKEQITRLLQKNENKILGMEEYKKVAENNILKAEKERVDLQRTTEESIKQIKSKTDKEKQTLTESHNIENSKKNEETDELNKQIAELKDERDSLKTDLLSTLLKDPNKIEVSLDKQRFYEDICKNIKNIIINAYFLDMLFDKQLESKPKMRGGGDKDGLSSSLSPAEAERYKNIENMKNTILSARDNLNIFLQDLVTKLNIDNAEITSGLQNIDGFARAAVQLNMAAYLAASVFFMMGGYKELNKGINYKGVNDKIKKGKKTLKSLGLRNKKLTKSLRSVMKGGNPEELNNLITKVITDICQQITLTKDLLKYIPDVYIDTNLIDGSLIVFTTIYKERNMSDKIESITNFLIPYKEPEIKNQDIAKLIEEINKYLIQKKGNDVEAEKVLSV
jgi:hypothetical protein